MNFTTILCTISILVLVGASPAIRPLNFDYQHEFNRPQKSQNTIVKESPKQDDRIYFFPPEINDELPPTLRNEPKIKNTTNIFVPKPCEDGMPLCSNATEYPENYMDYVVVENVTVLIKDQEFDFDERYLDFLDKDPGCPVRRRVLYPTKGMTRNKQWRYILNNDMIKQRILVGICLKVNQTCASDNKSWFGRRSECTQQYKSYYFQALDYSGKVVGDHFRLPISCECVTRKVFAHDYFLTRTADSDEARIELH